MIYLFPKVDRSLKVDDEINLHAVQARYEWVLVV